MAITTRRALCVALLVLVLLYSSRSLLSCVFPSPEAIFTYSLHPDFPPEGFARGELGVLQPTYARSYLVVAYRYLSGVGLDAAEQKAVLALWQERLGQNRDSIIQDPIGPWRVARYDVPGVDPRVDPLPSLNIYRRFTPKEFIWYWYLNCPADAFQTAARTLEQRIAQFGAESTEVRDWLQAQDQVFANCEEGQTIPAPAPEGAKLLLRADRMYQIAAANFYAGNFIEARKLFADIAADASSPWKQIAPYLIARTLLREAMLSSDAPDKVDKDLLAQAETRLLTVLRDQSLSEQHAAAQRLLNLVRSWLHPTDRIHELAGYILQKNAGETFKQSLWDYTALLDRTVGDEVAYGTYDMEKRRQLLHQRFAALADIRSKDDVTDWVLTFQGTGEALQTHALQKWRETASLPWLVASLAKIDVQHPDASALLDAAQKVTPDFPAFPTVAYHSARLLIELSSKDKVRAQLDSWLSSKSLVFPPSARNAFLALRMQLARNLGEFLVYAQRVPATISSDINNLELPPTEPWDEAEKTLKLLADRRVFFDKDATQALNVGMPLSLLTEAASSQRLPVHLRRELALAAWIRATLLDDAERGKALAPIVADLQPTLKADLDAYLSADTPEARKFAAVFLILKFPGTRPYVGSGLSRQTPLNKIGSKNWWCPLVQQFALVVAPPSSPAFLDQSQRAVAQKEWQQLSAISTAPNYLTQHVIDWAKRHPKDPRVPEALHLAVRSTRYGCTDAETSKFSKAAFLLLHKRYPDNPWTKKTPYWY